MFVLSAYYYNSEKVYAFLFGSYDDAKRFAENDPTPEKHEQWTLEYVNDPKLYGTGHEMNAHD